MKMGENVRIQELMEKRKKLEEERAGIDKEIELLKEEVQKQKEQTVLDKINSYSAEEKAFMLSLVTHSCASCEEDLEYPLNGLCGDTFRCNKCMLQEILSGEHDGKYDFSFSVDIRRVKA